MTQTTPQDNPPSVCACQGGRRQVGQVTPEERDQIQALFERKNGLIELVRSLAGEQINEALYEKIIADLGRVTTRFQAWWDKAGRRYGWESQPGGRWEVDFETCAIYLVAGPGAKRSAGGSGD